MKRFLSRRFSLKLCVLTLGLSVPTVLLIWTLLWTNTTLDLQDQIYITKHFFKHENPTKLPKKIRWNFFKEDFIKFDKQLGPLNEKSNMVNNQDGEKHEQNGRKVGILIPSTTKELRGQKLIQFTLVKHCLPSVLKTINGGYVYTIFIGFDSDDALFLHLKRNIKSKHIRFVSVVEHSFVAAVNTVAKTAYDEGMDYLMRINDDTVITSTNWTSKAVHVLNNYDPPNIGVVGPKCDKGKTSILTHDMVHRSHFEIFNYYYPPAFQNWWVDDWVTQIYQPQRSTMLEDWTIKHLVQSPRYKVDRSLEKQLGKAIIRDNEKIISYILQKRNTMRNQST